MVVSSKSKYCWVYRLQTGVKVNKSGKINDYFGMLPTKEPNISGSYLNQVCSSAQCDASDRTVWITDVALNFEYLPSHVCIGYKTLIKKNSNDVPLLQKKNVQRCKRNRVIFKLHVNLTHLTEAMEEFNSTVKTQE